MPRSPPPSKKPPSPPKKKGKAKKKLKAKAPLVKHAGGPYSGAEGYNSRVGTGTIAPPLPTRPVSAASNKIVIPNYRSTDDPDEDMTRMKSDTAIGGYLLPEHVTRGQAEDIDWRMCKIAWILNQLATLPYFITLGMCFTVKGSSGNSLFDSKHKTMFIWAMLLILGNSWVTGAVIWNRSQRTQRMIAWAQGLSFAIANVSLMMVVHNGTFVSHYYLAVNTYYAGPPEVASQFLLWTSIMGFVYCK